MRRLEDWRESEEAVRIGYRASVGIVRAERRERGRQGGWRRDCDVVGRVEETSRLEGNT